MPIPRAESLIILCLRIREYAENHDLSADQIEALLNAVFPHAVFSAIGHRN